MKYIAHWLAASSRSRIASFTVSFQGANASAWTYSIIQTAKANHVNVYHYLCFLLEKAPSALMTDEELEAFAPWNEDVKEAVRLREEAANQ